MEFVATPFHNAALINLMWSSVNTRMAVSSKLLITNARLVNEGRIQDADVLVRGQRIEKIAGSIAAGDGVATRMEIVATPFHNAALINLM